MAAQKTDMIEDRSSPFLEKMIWLFFLEFLAETPDAVKDFQRRKIFRFPFLYRRNLCTNLFFILSHFADSCNCLLNLLQCGKRRECAGDALSRNRAVHRHLFYQ